LMASAAVLVNPSRREGFGLVVAEAAAAGTPSVVVAGEDNAAAELVHDGVNGFVARSVAADELGAAILEALDAGDGLRVSTRAWFESARETQNLGRSVDELLARYAAPSAR
ncbi:glycosyltransferase, partial [Paenibacillus sp. TAF58]